MNRSESYFVQHSNRELLRSLAPDPRRVADIVGDALNRAESALQSQYHAWPAMGAGSASAAGSGSGSGAGSGAGSGSGFKMAMASFGAADSDAGSVSGFALPFIAGLGLGGLGSQPARAATASSSLLAKAEGDLSTLNPRLFPLSTDAQTALAIQASLVSQEQDSAAIAAASEALSAALAPLGLQTVPDSEILRDGHCLPNSVRWALKHAGREAPADAAAVRKLIGAELTGPHRQHWHNYDSMRLSGADFVKQVLLWVETGDWKAAMLPTALAAIADTFNVLLVLLRASDVEPVVTFAPEHGGVRSVLFLGHELAPKAPHFRPIVQSAEALRATFSLSKEILKGVLLASYGAASVCVVCPDHEFRIAPSTIVQPSAMDGASLTQSRDALLPPENKEDDLEPLDAPVGYFVLRARAV